MFVEKERRLEGERHVYDKAADLIEKRGHSQGALYGMGGTLCMWAAITEASRGRRAFSGEPMTKAHSRILYCLPIEGGICGYNNMHTKEEVIATLRRAAKEVVL